MNWARALMSIAASCGLMAALQGAEPAVSTPGTAPAAPPPAPSIGAGQASYDFGLTLGEKLRMAGLSENIAMDAVERGVRDGLDGKRSSANDQQQLAQYVRSVRENVASKNKETAREFLADNAQQKGVKSTPSGLQYRVLDKGDANKPTPQPIDQVVVQYRGKLIDGTEFDSSYGRGQPSTFQASRVIKGWQEALGMMRPGAKWQLFVPPELAYDLNSPSGIPPGSLLIFDIELLSVQAPPKSG